MAFSMQLKLASLILPCVFLPTFFSLAHGSGAGLPSELNATTTFLSAHNRYRSIVHIAPLKWSPRLATKARWIVGEQEKMKQSCRFANMSASEYGANQALGGLSMGPQQAVDLWGSRGQFYNHANNTCAPGHECHVYTQIVWKKTVEVGCAQAWCYKEDATLALCLYFPPGNVIGEKPY
ncbi:sts14 protein-like [Asimina triloba]